MAKTASAHTHTQMHFTHGRGEGQSEVARSCITLCEVRLALTPQPPHANLAQTQTL